MLAAVGEYRSRKNHGDETMEPNDVRTALGLGRIYAFLFEANKEWGDFDQLLVAEELARRLLKKSEQNAEAVDGTLARFEKLLASVEQAFNGSSR